MNESPPRRLHEIIPQHEARIAAARRLIGFGPSAKPNLRRLLIGYPHSRPVLVSELVRANAKWSVDELMGLCEKMEDGVDRLVVVRAVESLSGQSFRRKEDTAEEALVLPPRRAVRWWRCTGPDPVNPVLPKNP